MTNIMEKCLNPNCQQQNISGTKFCSKCGTNFVLRNRYHAVKFISEGAFGRTFLAVDADKLNKPCVIKQFLPQQLGSGALTKATELFEQEAQRLDHLGSHPQIPDLLAFFEQEGKLYLIQQFINGQDLYKELSKNGKFSENQVRDLLNQVLPVLEFIHKNNVIHRDIKPENIIRNQQGILVLIDFGVSKLFSGSIVTQMGTIAGTPGYAAPEQMRGMVYPASDIYSLGVTAIRLLTGCLQEERNGSIVDEIFDPRDMEWIWKEWLNKQGFSVSNDLATILDKMLQEKVKNRFESAAEVLAALQANKVQKPVVSPPVKSQVSSSSSFNLKTVNCDYSQLDKLLDAKNWKEADIETERVMLKVANREKESWFDSDSIKKFPCEDLKIIDQLWVKHSNGRFGFSVQKRIWQKRGFSIMADTVGWRRDSFQWVDYKDLDFSSNAPVGHLPTATFCPFRLVHCRNAVIFSRLFHVV